MKPPSINDEAMETSSDSPVVQKGSHILAAMGLDAEPGGVGFGCDCTKLSRASIPSIIFGPGSIEQAHTIDEYVEVAQVQTALDFYRKFIMEFE